MALSVEEKVAVLLQNGALSVAEIKTAYRTRYLIAPPATLPQYLAGPRFVRRPGDRYLLAEHAEAEAVTTSVAATTTAPSASANHGAVSLFSLPRLLDGDFAVVDVETTGLDPAHDKVFQVAAVRFHHGIPVAAFNRYLSPAPQTLSPHLQCVLNIEANAEIAALLAHAPAPEAVLHDIHAFLEGLPWVAHNVAFDYSFLCALGLAPPPFVFDTLELAGLVFPTIASLREEEVAGALGITPQSAAAGADIKAALAVLDGPAVYGDYHNALTDVLVLSAVLRELTTRLPPVFHDAIARCARKEPFFATVADWSAVAAQPDTVPPTVVPQRSPGSDSGGGFDPLVALHAYHRSRGRAPRPAQDRMLSLIHDALAAGEPCACEAPTGTGKTLAYIFPFLSHALQTKTKAALCTATRNLQDQLAEELEQIQTWSQTPDARQAGMPRFEWAILKGKGNYLCYSRLTRRVGEFLQMGRSSPEDAYACLYWTAFAQTTDTGLLDDAPPALRRRFPLLNVWREEIGARADCATSGDGDNGSAAAARAAGERPRHDRCFRARLLARASVADIVVMNHALFLHNRGNVENIATVAADEAHELETVATSFGERAAASWELRALLRQLLDPSGNTGLLVLAQSALATPGGALQKTVAVALGHTRRAQQTELPALGMVFREFLRRLRLAEDPKFGATLAIPAFPERTLSIRWRDDVRRAWRELADGQLRPLLRLLGEIAVGLGRQIQNREGLRHALDRAASQLTDLLQIAEETLAPRNRRYVYTLKTEPGALDVAPEWSLTATPIDISPLLASAFAELPCALVSATLDTGSDSPSDDNNGGDENAHVCSSGGGMRYVLDRVGLGFVPARRRYLLPAVLPYKTNAVFAIARAMVHLPLEHTRESFVSELADAYTRLTALSQGRALLLFTARSRMTGVTDKMRDALEADAIKLFVQGEDQPARLLSRFRDEKASVLAGLRQFWQGVDVPGESLSLVFLEKLPFPLFTDPLTAARALRVEMRGDNAFEDYLLPGMLIAFKQGFGRLLRDADDTGAVVLFDRRVATKTYLRRLEGCLPGFVPRDPLAEATWPGLASHLRRTLPHLLPAESGLPERLDPPASRLPVFDLPLQGDNRDNGDTDDAVIYDSAREALSAFGFPDFRTPEQARVTVRQLQHRDVLGLMPTGSGKSLTFQLPALVAARGMTLVISPLIALMRDQVESLAAKGFENVAALYSGQASDERADILERSRLGRIKLLYIAPERLRDPVLREVLRRVPVRALVVDEAHCVYSWGPHFRPEFLAIPEIFSLTGRIPVAAVTATAPPARRAEILRALGLDPANVTQVVSSFARPELRFFVYNAVSRFNQIRGPQDKLRALLKLLAAARRDGHSAVVYVNTTSGAELLASQLQLAGFDARAYHGKMTSRERNDVQDLFMDDHIRTVVCTKAFGMGIDKSGVRYVIHYDVPGDPVAYAQEAGRAGRSMPEGDEAYCVLLYHPGDAWIHYKFAEGHLPDEALLVAVARDIRENALRDDEPTEAAGAPVALLYEVSGAVSRLSDEFPDVDETAVNVALYRLRTLGFVERGTDIVVEALIFRAPGSPELGEGAESGNRLGVAPAVRAAVNALLARAPEGRAVGHAPTDLAKAAARYGVPLTALSDALARFAVDGTLLFTPIRRAARLAPQAPLNAGAHPTIGAAERARLRSESLASWRAMEAWATQTRTCRAAELLRYLGEPTEPTPCGKCDVCAPPPYANNAPPWADIADEDIPRPVDNVEVAGLFLESIAWNLERPADGDGAILGERTLWAILTGDDFYLRKYAPRRLERARHCPFYGWFRSFPGRAKGLTRLLDNLIRAGYAARAEITFTPRAASGAQKNDDADDAESAGENVVRYHHPDLTSKGRESLRTGEYIIFDQETALP